MIVTVAEVIGKLHEQKRTCILTFQLESEEHLLKFFFKDGEICSITFGDRRNLDCLPLLREGTYKKYSFIDDVGAHIPAGGLASADILTYIKTVDRTVASGAESVYGHSVKVEALGPDVIRQVEDAFVEAAGPVAPILLDDCLRKLNCPRGAHLSKGTLNLIVRLLSEELPEKERAGFLNNFRVTKSSGAT